MFEQSSCFTKRARTWILAFGISVSVPCAALSGTLVVRSDGSGEFTSIQDAVDASQDADTLDIRGEFFEVVEVVDKSVVMTAHNSASLDSRLLGPCMTFRGNSRCEIRGLRLLRGKDVVPGIGAGINVLNECSVRVSDCEIFDCEGRHGAAVDVSQYGTVALLGCRVSGNRSESTGYIIGGYGALTVVGCQISGNDNGSPINIYRGSGRIEGNLIEDNRGAAAGAIAISSEGLSTVVRNLIVRCSGITGAVVVEPVGTALIAENTFVDNSAFGGGQAHLVAQGASEVIRNLLIGGAGGSLVEVGDQAEFSCNDVWSASDVPLYHGPDRTGTNGNISVDPIFCDDPSFCLSADSPCLVGHHPDGDDCGTMGARESCCDPTPTRETSWGRLKSRFR